jgi:hypothetical protein
MNIVLGAMVTATEIGLGHPARADWQEIFTLNQKVWLSVAE